MKKSKWIFEFNAFCSNRDACAEVLAKGGGTPISPSGRKGKWLAFCDRYS